MAQGTSEVEETNAGGEDAQQIRESIERTREEMSHTIDAIQEKLDPEHIKEHVKDAVHEATIGRAEQLAHTASEKLSDAAVPAAQSAREKGAAALSYARLNPLPAVLGAAALLLLLRALLRPDGDLEINFS